MPFRLDENRTTIKFITFAQMPSLIYRACLATGVPSNTRYVQEAICEKLARDTGEPLPSLLAKLPPTRSNSSVLFGDDRRAVKNPRPIGEVK